MGGHAFSESRPDAQFPRMSPAVYAALKGSVQEQLLPLFRHIAVPREAPGKPDYGDLDFIVAEPIGEVTVDTLKAALRTELAVGADVATTSFAIPLPQDGHGSGAAESAFVQVDVHKCASVDEFNRVVFFHAYGDLGMILGLLARSYGLSLGQNGMKLVVGSAENGEPPSFFLTADFPHIMRFFALDMAPWQRGFESQLAVFEWVRSSRLFHPACLRESARREHRRRDRAMYHNFLQYVRELESSGAYADVPQLSREQVIAEAKREFGKEDEYNALVLSNRRRAHYKAVFNGHLVMEWTGLQGKAVREVMDVVRARVSEADMLELSLADVEALVKGIHADRLRSQALATSVHLPRDDTLQFSKPASKSAQSRVSSLATELHAKFLQGRRRITPSRCVVPWVCGLPCILDPVYLSDACSSRPLSKYPHVLAGRPPRWVFTTASAFYMDGSDDTSGSV